MASEDRGLPRPPPIGMGVPTSRRRAAPAGPSQRDHTRQHGRAGPTLSQPQKRPEGPAQLRDCRVTAQQRAATTGPRLLWALAHGTAAGWSPACAAMGQPLAAICPDPTTTGSGQPSRRLQRRSAGGTGHMARPCRPQRSQCGHYARHNGCFLGHWHPQDHGNHHQGHLGSGIDPGNNCYPGTGCHTGSSHPGSTIGPAGDKGHTYSNGHNGHAHYHGPDRSSDPANTRDPRPLSRPPTAM